MEHNRPARILVVTDHTAASPELLEAIRRRAAEGDAQFRILVPNPAKAELHLLHPERHDKAAEAEAVLHEALPAFEAAAGRPVLASVSIRHETYDAIEELMLNEPVDEVVLSVLPHGHHSWLHPDLQHRLTHLGLPVTLVEHPPAARP
jgi:nucleotide-binding universal stress UspA family protein